MPPNAASHPKTGGTGMKQRAGRQQAFGVKPQGEVGHKSETKTIKPKVVRTPAEEETRIAAAEARRVEMLRRQEEMDKLVREVNAQKETL